jgi:alpha-D-ribose 1-methylphosphonate 5-triphosphate synthase subunit PhnG
MSRLRRTRVLVDGDPALSTGLCERIRGRYAATTLAHPRELLVVVRVRESAKGSLFYLAEALATECRVLVEGSAPRDGAPRDGTSRDGAPWGSTGIGLLLGSERRRAFELAVIDAAMSASFPLPEEAEWTALLLAEEQRLARARYAEWERLGQTRVEFSSMLTEEDARAGV